MLKTIVEFKFDDYQLYDQNLSAEDGNTLVQKTALLHKDLKYKAPLIEPNLRRNLGKWST
ncbi:hypothetical protein KNR02_06100 [Acinetobacter baumannii]|nr:hypothetical protein [Acinetobacter baumannii]